MHLTLGLSQHLRSGKGWEGETGNSRKAADRIQSCPRGQQRNLRCGELLSPQSSSLGGG